MKDFQIFGPFASDNRNRIDANSKTNCGLILSLHRLLFKPDCFLCPTDLITVSLIHNFNGYILQFLL